MFPIDGGGSRVFADVAAPIAFGRSTSLSRIPLARADRPKSPQNGHSPQGSFRSKRLLAVRPARCTMPNLCRELSRRQIGLNERLHVLFLSQSGLTTVEPIGISADLTMSLGSRVWPIGQLSDMHTDALLIFQL